MKFGQYDIDIKKITHFEFRDAQKAEDLIAGGYSNETKDKITVFFIGKNSIYLFGDEARNLRDYLQSIESD